MISARLEVDREPGQVTWKLPPRDLGKARILGAVVMVASLLIFGFAWLWGGDFLMDAVEKVSERTQEWNTGDFIELVFLVPFFVLLIFGIRVFWTGIAVLNNRTRTVVTVDREQIRIREIFGGWRKKRKIGLGQISAWELGQGDGSSDGEENVPVQSLPLVPEDFWTLTARLQDGNTAAIAFGYPRQLVHELATQLGAQVPSVRLTQTEESFRDDSKQLSEKGGAVRIPDRPLDTRVEMQQVSDGVGVSVPAQGIWKGSHGLFLFGLIFDLFATVFFVILLLSEETTGKDLLMFGGFLSIFVLVGAGVMLAGVAMGTRRALIAVRGDLLRVETTSVFGVKQEEWRSDQIDSIRVANTGTEVNGKPLSAIYIDRKEGESTAWLKMLTREEQNWIAAHLRNALKLSSDEI